MENTDSSQKPNKLLARLGKLLKFLRVQVPRYFFELAIVFIGVYLAFQLTELEDEIEKREIRIKYFDSLISEFSMVAFYLDEEERNLLPHLAALEKMQQGDQPPIPTRSLYFVAPRIVVTAAFDSRNFESLNEETIEGIIQGSPLLESLEQRIDTFNELLLAFLETKEADIDCCYDDNGKLLDSLNWYPTLVEEIHELNRVIRESLIDVAIPNLQQLKSQLTGENEN